MTHSLTLYQPPELDSRSNGCRSRSILVSTPISSKGCLLLSAGQRLHTISIVYIRCGFGSSRDFGHGP